MNNNEYDFWFWLSVMANFAQLESYRMNVEQISNDELMKYLEHQDQNYLKKIVEQNEEIIRLLKGGDKNA